MKNHSYNTKFGVYIRVAPERNARIRHLLTPNTDGFNPQQCQLTEAI